MTTKLIVLLCLLAVSQARFINNKHSLISSRIVGGVDAQPGEFPRHVSLHYGMPPIIKYKYFCAGSIINERWILTAGFCKQMIDIVSIDSVVVKAGKHALNVDEPTQQESYAESYFINKNDVKRDRLEQPIPPTDNVILIKLKTPLRFNEYVSAIGLPVKGNEPTGTVIISGWGALVYDKENPKESNILQKASLEIIDRETCKKAVVAFGEVAHEKYNEDLVGETNVCTGPLTGGVSPCNGDFGGPLIRKDKDGKTELVAKLSWFTPCGRKGGPAVYVNVGSIVDWIQDIISKK